MKKNYKTPLFRAVFLSGKSSLMVTSGSQDPEKPSGYVNYDEESDTFTGNLFGGGTSAGGQGN